MRLVQVPHKATHHATSRATCAARQNLQTWNLKHTQAISVCMRLAPFAVADAIPALYNCTRVVS